METNKESIIITNDKGEIVDIDVLIDEIRKDSKRILVDDEIGIVIYTADLNYYSARPQMNGLIEYSKINQIAKPRFSTPLIRRQIGSVVSSVSSDTVFLIKVDNFIKKVRADKLKKGMILISGEKVYS